MGLVLRSQRHATRVVEPDARGVRRLEGEHPWVVEGDAALVAIAFEDLRDVAQRIHSEVLHLDFGNAVGVFRVRELGTIEVVSGKWNEHHFDSMLADVARIASALPFAAGTAGPLPYDRTLSTRDDLLYHAYVYIRHILSDSAPQGVRLISSLNAILAEPYRRVERETVNVSPEWLQRVDDATTFAIASGTGPLVYLPAARLPAVLGGYLPARVPERHCKMNVDTPENRFVKAFLDQICSVLRRMREVLATETRVFASRVRAECVALEERMAPFRVHPIWREVGAMTNVPTNSTVLQRRRGYREVLRHFVLLRLATRHLPISAHDARDLLEGKDIARLYEIWCYFAVVEQLRSLLGAPSSVASVERTHLQAHVANEFEVRWPNGVRLLYNATFSRKSERGRQTYSLPLRPDVVLILTDGTVHVLDAKFKLEWLARDEEDDVDRARAKLDDVYKMHAYRDAIDAARSAWVLYPGTEVHEFVPRGHDGEVEGVGAVPLRPEEGGGTALHGLLERILSSTRAA
jgi:hypothetical protein